MNLHVPYPTASQAVGTIAVSSPRIPKERSYEKSESSCVRVVPCLAAPLALAKDGNVEQQISALSDAMIQANLKGDTSFYQKYYAEDATIVHGNGKLFTKDQELADLKSGSLKYESIDVREKTIHTYGNTAVVHILLTFKGLLSEKPFGPIDLRRTVVWVNQKGNWKIVAWQVRRVESK